MRSIPLYTFALFALGSIAATGGTANASEDHRHLDSTIVDIDRATGQAWFDNGMSLDPSIYTFKLRNSAQLGDRVRLQFGGTGFLWRVGVVN